LLPSVSGDIARSGAKFEQDDSVRKDDSVLKKAKVEKKTLGLDDTLLDNEKEEVVLSDYFDTESVSIADTKSVAFKSVSSQRIETINQEQQIKDMFKKKKYKDIVKLLKLNHKKEYEKEYYYKSLLKLKKCDVLKKIKNLSRYLTKSELESYGNCK